jgi:NDP-sugar pyrophosphorylase family protein
MKCLILCYASPYQWLTRYLSTPHVYLTHVLNKPWLAYYLDFCKSIGVNEALILQSLPSAPARKLFQGGEKWGLKIAYGFLNEKHDLKNILSLNHKFYSKHSLLIISGLQFILFDQNKQLKNIFNKTNSHICYAPNQEYLAFIKKMDLKMLPNLPIKQKTLFPSYSIQNIKEYFQLNMNILNHHAHKINLPGYNDKIGQQYGAHIQKNSSCHLKKPYLLGNQLVLHHDVQLGPQAIIGHNVIIDAGTKIQHSLIYAHSYVGKNLNIENKIVCQNRLIDPYSDSYLDIRENFILSKIKTNIFSKAIYKFFTFSSALLLSLFLIIPFLLISFLSKLCMQKVFSFRTIYLDKNSKTKNILALNKHNFFYKLFRRFCSDKFIFLKEFYLGNFALVGYSPLTTNPTNLWKIKELGYQKPGVFNYSDQFNFHLSTDQIFLNDLYYAQNKSMFLDITIILKKLIYSLLLNKYEKQKIKFNLRTIWKSRS